MRSVEVGGESLTEYFQSLLKEKSQHKKIISPLLINYSCRRYNFETREKNFELKNTKLSESIEIYFERALARKAKEKVIHFVSSTNEQNQSSENTFELPDGEKVKFESQFSFDRNFFDKKENNPQTYEIQNLVTESLNSCDVDIRKNVISSVVLAGGNSLIPKFKESFEEILNQFVNLLYLHSSLEWLTPYFHYHKKNTVDLIWMFRIWIW